MSETISHEGIIESINRSHARVRIVRTSACSGCKLASGCSSSEAKEKIVDVWDGSASGMSIGDKVTVMARSSVGFLAVMYGFCLPLVVMTAVVLATDALGWKEIWCALSGIAALLPVYLVIRLMNRYFEKKISFTVRS